MVGDDDKRRGSVTVIQRDSDEIVTRQQDCE